MVNQSSINLEGNLMSNLLINEPPLQVLPSLAAAIGLNEALFIQQLHYWLRHAKVEHDGKRWIYKTYDKWRKQDFPFWSTRTIRRIAESLIEQQLITTAFLADNSFNRVNHYTINYEQLSQIEQKITASQVSTDKDNLSASHRTDCPQHKDTLSASDKDRLSTSLRDLKETNKENIDIGDFHENDVIAANQNNANSIANWQAPSRNEMQAELVRAGSVLNMTDDQYEIYVDDFKGHFEQNALAGKPLTGDRNRKNRLRQWLENIAKKQPKSNVFQGNNNANYQPANNQHQPKQSSADIYAANIARELAEYEAAH